MEQVNRIHSQCPERCVFKGIQRPCQCSVRPRKFDASQREMPNKLRGMRLKSQWPHCLLHVGKVSHEEAEAHALGEFEKYGKVLESSRPDELDEAMKRLKEKK